MALFLTQMHNSQCWVQSCVNDITMYDLDLPVFSLAESHHPMYQAFVMLIVKLSGSFDIVCHLLNFDCQ